MAYGISFLDTRLPAAAARRQILTKTGLACHPYPNLLIFWLQNFGGSRQGTQRAAAHGRAWLLALLMA